MVDDPAELPFLSNVGLMLTFRCTTACPHCVVDAGPHRKETMPIERSLDWIDQIRAYRGGRVCGLALTGGEPFTDRDNLAKVSNYGDAAGFIVSAVTNAFWATSPETAIDVLAGLPAIRMLSISTDIYHLMTIPFEFVRNAIVAARELGRLYNIAVCTDSKDEPGFLNLLQELDSIGERDTLRISIIFPVGRAQRRAKRFRYRLAETPPAGACSMASSPVIFPNGDVVACIGPPLTLPHQQPMHLGNALEEPLSEIFDRAESNVVLHTIRTFGPQRLVSLLREHGYESLLPDRYICDCACDICYKLMSDPRTVRALGEIAQDGELQRLVAYARLYYLGESQLAEILDLNPIGADASSAAVGSS